MNTLAASPTPLSRQVFQISRLSEDRSRRMVIAYVGVGGCWEKESLRVRLLRGLTILPVLSGVDILTLPLSFNRDEEV